MRNIYFHKRVRRASVVNCLTRNPGVKWFVPDTPGMSLCQILQRPSLVLLKPRIDMNHVNCLRDMTDILLKAA